MCVIIAKYFENIGWVGIKNRDRNYIPEISFKKVNHDGMEIMYFWDDITQYCEGFNEKAIGVLSASLMVRDDEKEIEVRSGTPSKDGIKIQDALKYPTVKDVAQSLINDKLTGHTFIFDKESCYLLEGAWVKGKYKKGEYEYFIDELSKDTAIARTNHGIKLQWAGYQRDESPSHTLSRISSESRMRIAQFVVNNATTPENILDGLTEDYTGNGQLNALRTTHDKKKMRTTSQTMIVPSTMTMYIRPVQSHLTYNFWELNTSDSKTFVEILSNRILYHGKHDKTFFQKLQHKI